MALSPIPPSVALVSSLNNGTPLNPREQSSLASFTFLNPNDGATIKLQPNTVAARAQNGDVITLYRKTLDYSFATSHAFIASLANGTIAASEEGTVVEISPDKQVSVLRPHAPPVTLGILGHKGFDPRSKILATHAIDAQTCDMLLKLHANGNDLSTLPRVRQDFDISTDNYMSKVQLSDIAQRFGGSSDPKAMQSQNGLHERQPENEH